MSSETTLGLLLDGPMQSWGCGSRFDRRTTLLHPTRSGIIGVMAAALGIDKYGPDESTRLEPLNGLGVTIFWLPRRSRAGEELLVARLEDYHTITGIRRAHGKIDEDATVQSYRHYLLDARFGVLLDGPQEVLNEVAQALRNPRWGVWLGRKCCLPATPLLVSEPAERATCWKSLLQRAGYGGDEPEETFDRVVETNGSDPEGEVLADAPTGFGRPIGERHGPRCVRRVLKKAASSETR